jgi:hypothetical protein
MSTIELGDLIIEDDDTYIDVAGTTIRLHKSGNDIQLQIKEGDEWVTYQTWGS